MKQPTETSFRLYGFATGHYQCKCYECNSDFMGDKRAVMCLPCAIEKAEEHRKVDDDMNYLFWQLLRSLEMKSKSSDILDRNLIESAYKLYNKVNGSELVPDHKSSDLKGLLNQNNSKKN